MATIEAFRSYLAEDLPQMPAVALKKKIVEVLVDFCRETRCLVVDATDIVLVAATGTYDIVFTGTYYPVELYKVFNDDDNRVTVTSLRNLNGSVEWEKETTEETIASCFLTEASQLRVYPIPVTPTATLSLSCYVVPTWAATEIEDRVYNDWLPVIRSGVLGEVLRQKGRPWTDIEMSGFYSNEYAKGRADAKARILQGKADNQVFANYGGSSMF